MKKSVLAVFLIAALSCTGNMDPYSINWNQGSGQSQSSDPADEGSPSESGVDIEDEESSDDNVNNTDFGGEISLTYSNSGVTVSGEVQDVDIVKDGARVTVTNSGDKVVRYVLSGSCSDGCFKLYSSKKQAIVLNSLTLTNTGGAAINNQSKKRTFVVLKGTNAVSDGALDSDGDYPDQIGDEDMKAAFFSEGQLIFSGSGSLSVKAIGKSGITSDDYVRFMSGCNVTVSATNGHGVRGKDAIIVSGGNVSVTLESSAEGKKCFTSDSLVFIGGGVTTLVNKAPAVLEDSELTGASCIKADETFVIQGGELNATASGKGGKCISGDGNGYFEGGTVVAKATGSNYGGNSYSRYDDSDTSTSAKAIKFDGNLEFSGSDVSASASSHEAIEAKGTLYVSGGRISVTSSDDAINSGSTMTVSDGVIYAYSTGNDAMDANGDMIIGGGTVFAIGTREPEVGLDANTEGGYKLYIQGGNIIVVGGLENSSYVGQPIISTSWSANKEYSLCDGDDAFFSFKTPSSGGSGLYMSAPGLVSGSSYTLKTSATVSGATSCIDGILSTGGSATGGSSSSVTAQSYSTGSGTHPGDQGGPGGPGWRW